jgi:hypothetical protein
VAFFNPIERVLIEQSKAEAPHAESSNSDQKCAENRQGQRESRQGNAESGCSRARIPCFSPQKGNSLTQFGHVFRLKSKNVRGAAQKACASFSTRETTRKTVPRQSGTHTTILDKHMGLALPNHPGVFSRAFGLRTHISDTRGQIFSAGPRTGAPPRARQHLFHANADRGAIRCGQPL